MRDNLSKAQARALLGCFDPSTYPPPRDFRTFDKLAALGYVMEWHGPSGKYFALTNKGANYCEDLDGSERLHAFNKPAPNPNPCDHSPAPTRLFRGRVCPECGFGVYY